MTDKEIITELDYIRESGISPELETILLIVMGSIQESETKRLAFYLATYARTRLDELTGYKN